MGSQGDIGRNKNDSTWPEDGALHLHREWGKVKALATPELAVVDSEEKGKEQPQKSIVTSLRSRKVAVQPTNHQIPFNCLFAWVS